ncbi:MAG: GNAT family protein [Candidatus Eremiobacterota bacterium]
MDEVTLTPLVRDDLPRLFEWVNDRELMHFSGAFRPVSWQEHEAWFERVSTDPDHRALAVRSGAQLAGLAQLCGISAVHHNAELRIRLGPEFLGRGLGTRATRLLLHLAFADLSLERVYLWVQARNERAIRSYLKCGFRVEGTLRRHSFVDGEFRDILAMGILAGEFEP